jgi:DNA-binding NarL/FixJ family response regulator
VGDGPRCGRILICDGDERTRTTFAAALVDAGYLAVAFVSGEAALRDTLQRRPDAVVIDLRVADMSGYALCSALRQRFGDSLPILFVSADRTDARDRVAGLLIGADEYLSKPVPSDEFVLRIKRLLELAPARARPGADLTARELEVLSLLADGLDEVQIADSLVISTKTVATHIQRILPKLGVHSRAQAVARAYREGLLGKRVVSD